MTALEFDSLTVGTVVERGDGWRYVKIAANNWLAISRHGYLNNEHDTDSQMTWQQDHNNTFVILIEGYGA